MRKSNTKKIILNAILLGIGMILNQIVPAIGAGITPDLTLVMLFSIVMLNRNDFKTCLISGIITGLFTAMTTKFPGGQVPNIIDKIVTVIIIYAIVKVIYASFNSDKRKKMIDLVTIILISIIGTMVSGFVFLFSASLIIGLPAGLMQLFIAVVLPTVVVNMIASVIVYNVINVSIKRTAYQF